MGKRKYFLKIKNITEIKKFARLEGKTEKKSLRKQNYKNTS